MEFEAVYIEHYMNVYRYVYSMCRDAELAEEITQQTFFKALENLDSFEGKCRLFVWLCQIAKNTYFSYRKMQKKHISENEVVLNLSVDESIEDRYCDKEIVWQLHQQLHQLDEPYKEVFSLRVFGELPFDKIGGLFGKTDSWARVVFYRAKQKLRRMVNED